MIDQVDTKSNVVSIKDYYETHDVNLTDDQKIQLENIFTQLTDKSVAAA